MASPLVVPLRAARTRTRRRRWRTSTKVRPLTGAEMKVLERVGELRRPPETSLRPTEMVARQRWF